jgi:uncharacterized membrane protein YtjA (UPF0391 family)
MLDLAIMLLCAAIGAAIVGFGGPGSAVAAHARSAFAVLVFLYCVVLVARQRVL